MRIIEGTWEQIQADSSQLEGRRVRVIVLDEPEDTRIEEGLPPPGDWEAALKWMDEHAVNVGHPVDDSRDSIYSGTLDDPR